MTVAASCSDIWEAGSSGNWGIFCRTGPPTLSSCLLVFPPCFILSFLFTSYNYDENQNLVQLQGQDRFGPHGTSSLPLDTVLP